MIESGYNQKLRKVLKDHGFIALKHADQFTVGIPDMSASGHGMTWWLEGKLYRGFKNPLCWRPIIKNKVQLEMMVALEKASHACYVLYQAKGRECHVYLVSPSAVWYSVRNNVSIDLGRQFTFEEVPQWLI